ncbi:MAG: aldehyde dehydrogenase family protein [Actinobacteria bacterium]|nr:aldehyde dehydrogenase family protein [Actinomycetota bacterium]
MTQPFYVAGEPRTSSTAAAVDSPFDGAHAGDYYVPADADVEEAVVAAEAALGPCRRLSAAQRAAALDHISASISSRSQEFVRTITAETGKPVKWSAAEVNRAASTFRWAAEETRRWSGELQRLDTDPAAAGRTAIVRRFAFGAVLGIAPFNFPLNLVAHKVAPALAVGAPIVIKPAPATPLTALLLGEVLAETELPEGSWSVLPLDNERTARLVTDPRLPIVSFTGSERVGYAIEAEVPHKHVTLELGGNAAAAVLSDWSGEQDIDWAVDRIATFATYQAGQSCISVQRVLLADSIYDAVLERLVGAFEALPTGSPWEPDTVVGPVINAAAAQRIIDWIGEATAGGASLLTGGTRDGNSVAPTILADVPGDAKVSCEEVFGPVITVTRVRDADEAFEAINGSRFGLQAGVFTHDLRVAFRAHRELEVGGVVIGDVPSFRADQMPYGGEKSSGVGREGLLAAMEDLTHARVLVLTGIDL